METTLKEKENVLKLVSTMLGCCRKPLREEQVWALCYECCWRMERLACDSRHRLRGPVQLNPSASLVIHKDGSVAFTTGPNTGKSVKTDREILYCLGWMLYSAVDSHIPDDREPDLSPSLEELLCAMLGLNGSNSRSRKNLQQKCTFKAIIEVCEKRFINPVEAANHYRKVCREEFAEQANICKALQTGGIKLVLTQGRGMCIKMGTVVSQGGDESTDLCCPIHQQCPRKLQLTNLDVAQPLTMKDWSFLWSNVVKELQNGVQLRNVSERLCCTLPIEYELTPFEHLMEDIRSKRYTLQKVTVCASKKKSIHASLLDFICLRPALKPASERKLKERSWEEPSLHELLMTEIKSTKKLRCRSMEVRRKASGFVARSTTWLANQSENCVLAGGLVNDDWLCKDMRTQLTDQDDTGLPFDGIPCWRLEYASTESSSNNTISIPSSPELDADLVFMPVLTSSQIDVKSGKNKSVFHQRSQSLQSSIPRKNHKTPRKALFSPTTLPTIADLIMDRQVRVNHEIQEFLEFLGFQKTNKDQVCFSCHKKKVFFTWPYECHICGSSMCPDCCTKMLMPFKVCIHLPVSFLKIVKLNRYEEPDSLTEQSHVFWEVADQWDCSRVPVVFEPHKRGDDCICYKKNMKNWFSMDLCTRCKEYLLDHIAINQECRVHEERPRMCTILESFYL